MPKKIRQYCDACRQVTTQIKEESTWKCLCCESAKFRGKEATAEIQKNPKRARLNQSF